MNWYEPQPNETKLYFAYDGNYQGYVFWIEIDATPMFLPVISDNTVRLNNLQNDF